MWNSFVMYLLILVVRQKPHMSTLFSFHECMSFINVLQPTFKGNVYYLENSVFEKNHLR